MGPLTTGQGRDRSEIEEKYKWNLADVFPDEAAWRASKDRVAREVKGLRSHQGRLGSSAVFLVAALDAIWQLDKEIARLAVYSAMLSDQDTREAGPQGMQQEVQQLTADFKAQTAFVEPELLQVGAPVIDGLLQSEPRLATYTFYLHDIA